MVHGFIWDRDWRDVAGSLKPMAPVAFPAVSTSRTLCFMGLVEAIIPPWLKPF